jgi:hypothetical protein
MAISYKTSIRNSRMDTITTSIGASGHLLVYTGSGPALTATPTGTLLSTHTLSNPLGAGSSGGVLTFGAIGSATAAASGTPGYFRCIDGATDDGTHTQIQGDAAVGSGSLNFGSTEVSGGSVSITSATDTEGNP